MHRNEKLAARFFGSFLVLERIGVAYRLQLPDAVRIHPVFHVSQLRKAIGNRVAAPTLPATITEEMDVMQFEKVEGVRMAGEGTGQTREVLIRWKDLLEYEATWEPYDMINRQFPEFNLEDKVHVWEGSRGILVKSIGVTISKGGRWD
ncbi:hypothetical protein OROGR_014309 [Orobanche gracilis]